jgi:RNA recognition motif-containing protein
MRIWIGNIAPGTTDDEIKAFVKKYGSELECTAIQRVEGDGSRPGAVLEFSGTSTALGNLALRLNGMYWKGRALISSTLIAP